MRSLALAAVLALTSAGAQGATANGDCNSRKILNTQIQCFLEAAEAAHDPTICERAVDHTVLFQCLSLYAEHTGDTAPCARIVAPKGEAETLRETCIVGVAIAEDAPEMCLKARNPNLRDSCYLMLVTEKGLDASLCQRIASPRLRSICVEP